MRLFHVVLVGIPLTIGVAGAVAARSPVRPSVVERAAMQAADTIDLVVGDTLQYARRRRLNPTTLLLVSSNPDVAGVIPGGGVVGRLPGVATITSTSIPPTVPPFIIRVKTPLQATNEFIPEVCANVDSQFFIDTLPVTTSVALIHEYHDCQRLIDSTGLYSGVVGIFATKQVRRFEAPADYLSGRLAALIVNFVGDKNLTYVPFDLKPGVSCLIVRSVRTGRGNGAFRWEAALIPQAKPAKDATGIHYGDCPDTLQWRHVPSNRIGQLAVVPQLGADLMGRRLAPPVARWDWDSVKRRNYMGVKCARAIWCEIGPAAGFTPSVARRNSSNQPIFKGFYDEQYLADTVGGPRPSTVFGTIMPGRDNQDIAQMSARNTTTQYHASVIELRETARNASREYNYYAAVFYTAAVSGNALLSRSSLTLQPLATSSGYLGELNGRPLPPHAIHFTQHAEQELVVPTVRWRWKLKDEGTWSYCYPDGCCEDMLIRY